MKRAEERQSIESVAEDPGTGKAHTDGIVHESLHRVLHPAMLATDQHHLHHLPGSLFVQSQFRKLAFLVELVARRQRLLERHAAIRGMQVEDVYTFGPSSRRPSAHNPFSLSLPRRKFFFFTAKRYFLQCALK